MLSRSIKQTDDGKAVIVDKELSAFFGSLSKESDRGIVVIVGTVVEERLARLLREVLIQREESESFISRNLGGLEARAKAAYCIGVISRTEYELIQFLRRVRNDFAHKFITERFDGSLEAKKSEVYNALALFIPGYDSIKFDSTRQVFEALSVHIITAIWDREHEFGDSDYIYERE